MTTCYASVSRTRLVPSESNRIQMFLCRILLLTDPSLLSMPIQREILVEDAREIRFNDNNFVIRCVDGDCKSRERPVNSLSVTGPLT